MRPGVLACLLMTAACADKEPADTGSTCSERVWYSDIDGDGYGDGNNSAMACPQPEGWVEEDGDCDDASPTIHPAATETCDDIDQDCDGQVDEQSADASPWWTDGDGDGFGASDSETVACVAPPGAASLGGDCDDGDADIHPAALEGCDGVDNDCDDQLDEGLPFSTWHDDLDGDGFGDPDSARTLCEQAPDTIAEGGDCDDNEAAVYPGAPELCNDGRVNDCLATEASARASCAWGSTVRGSDAHTIFAPDSTGLAGATVAGGDLDNDGRADLIIGSFAESGSAASTGVVYLWLSVPGRGRQSLATADLRLEGSGYWHAFGAAFATGDLTGDGIADLAISAPGWTNVNHEGAVYLLPGPLHSATTLADASLHLQGVAEAAALGSDLARVPDTDGDGVDELLIGCIGCDSAGPNAGGAWLIPGGQSGVHAVDSVGGTYIEGSDSWNLAGARVTGLQDIDGDGLGDFAVAAPESNEFGRWCGAVYVFSGPVTGTLSVSDADLQLMGEAGDNAGSSVADAGDTDGDGYSELLVGGPLNGDGGAYSGVVWLVDGGQQGRIGIPRVATATLNGYRTSSFGASADVVGDVDGDGATDFLVGSNYTRIYNGTSYNWRSSTSNAAWLYYGPLSGGLTNADADVLFDGSNDFFGADVAGVGDVDADGLDDFLISERSMGAAAYLFLSPGI